MDAIKRTIVYIDGFNLYFAMIEAGWRKYLWLDIHKFATTLIPSETRLEHVKYFTSRISGSQAKQKRQTAIIDANDLNPGTMFRYGNYQSIPYECRKCGHVYSKHQEKKTDVNIATEMLVDGFLERYDYAVLVSEDSDLVGPLEAIKTHLTSKHIHLAFPPGRFSHALRAKCHTFSVIKEASFSASQLPEEVVMPNGHVLRRPESWW
jgi:uncharacterized LabA/DUF88 family protein